MHSGPSAPAADKKFQRRTMLVKRSLQYKYIASIFVCVVLAVILIGMDLYYTLYKLLLLDNPSLVPLLQHANSVFIVRVLLYLAIVFVVALIISNRLAGPIYRFEKSAQEVGAGNLTHRVSLRTGDELLELQEEFNAMVSGIQSLVQKDRNLVKRLSERLDALQKNPPAESGALREELKSIQAELEHLTSSFKV